MHKTYADAFEGTDLEVVLAARRVGRLFVSGAQTDECIRATPDIVIAHTNLYWGNHTAPGRTAGTVSTAEVVFATKP